MASFRGWFPASSSVNTPNCEQVLRRDLEAKRARFPKSLGPCGESTRLPRSWDSWRLGSIFLLRPFTQEQLFEAVGYDVGGYSGFLPSCPRLLSRSPYGLGPEARRDCGSVGDTLIDADLLLCPAMGVSEEKSGLKK